MDFLAPLLQLSQWQIIATLIVAVLIGISKTGIGAVSLLTIPIMASAYGGRESTGLILSILLIADMFAVKAYAQHGRWDEIKKLLPSALFGLAVASVVGKYVNDQQFKYLIAGIIILCLVFMVWQEIKGGQIKVPKSQWFVLMIGALSGFATMIGNAAGPIFAIYLLALGLNKKNYMGTTAWFFLIINLTKLPLQIFVWKNINLGTAMVALATLPAIFIGTRIGLWVIKALPEKAFRYIILGMTALVAIRLFF